MGPTVESLGKPATDLAANCLGLLLADRFATRWMGGAAYGLGTGF